MNTNDKWVQEFDNVLTYLSRELRLPLVKLTNAEKLRINEIRLRREKPLEIVMGNRSELLDYENGGVIVTRRDIETTFELLCSRSVYASTEEIAQGFVTIKGGHRAGICGHAVIKDGAVRTLRDISSINIRIGREVIGIADKVIPKILNKDRILNTIVISPPGFGKTTLLRDIARRISIGSAELGLSSKRVGIADERGELASMHAGVSRYDLGNRCDIMDGCPKGEGLMMLIRTMSPQVIIADEIAGKQDCDGVLLAARCGVSVICSAHGASIEDIMGNPNIRKLIEGNVFSVAILLNANKDIGQIYSFKSSKEDGL